MNISLTFEIELEVEGSVTGGDPSVGLMGPEVEDMFITNVFTAGRDGRNLMSGVDMGSKDIQRFLENLLEEIQDRAVEALSEAYDDQAYDYDYEAFE